MNVMNSGTSTKGGGKGGGKGTRCGRNRERCPDLKCRQGRSATAEFARGEEEGSTLNMGEDGRGEKGAKPFPRKMKAGFVANLKNVDKRVGRKTGRFGPRRERRGSKVGFSLL